MVTEALMMRCPSHGIQPQSFIVGTPGRNSNVLNNTTPCPKCGRSGGLVWATKSLFGWSETS